MLVPIQCPSYWTRPKLLSDADYFASPQLQSCRVAGGLADCVCVGVRGAARRVARL